MKFISSKRFQQRISRANQRRLLANLEKLEDRRPLAADLGLSVLTTIEGDLYNPTPYYYVADGRPIGLSPVPGELLLGARLDLGFSLAELFSANPVALGISLDSESHLGVSREVELDRSWIREIQPLSNRLVSLKLNPEADWNAGLAELFSSFTTERSPSHEDFWTAPVFRNAESGLRQWVTDEVIVMLEPNVDPELFFSDARFAGYRNLSGTNDQFVATVREATGLEALELSNQVLPDLPGVVWSTVNFVAEAQRNFTPNDPLYASQWHLNNVGQSGGRPDADIDMDLAWDVVTGNAGVVIAIIDDGVQTNHPDLDIWTNFGESPTPNGADTDGNGWTDDINGLNLVDAGPGLNDPNPTEPNENHGTAVAGSAATRANNALGIAAPAFGAKIMALKPINCFQTCFSFDDNVASTVYYAAGRTENGTGTWRGADVINYSYSTSPSSVNTAAFVWAATNGRNGIGAPVFASTGNSASGAVWARVNINIPFALDEGAQLEFRYTKDSSVSIGDDNVWISWARFPNNSVERFDTLGIPAGWGTFGNQTWGSVNPPQVQRAHGTGRYPLKSGAITHSQTTSLFTPEFEDSGGFDFRYWISSDAFDKLEVFVRYRDFFGSWGSWNQTNFLTLENNGNPVSVPSASGTSNFTPNANYPANLASTIGVGASTDWDYKADYSQYGPGLDFVAPSGGGIVDLWTTDRTGSAGYDPGSDYVAIQGTSFSSPVAAGVAALMLSRNPELTASPIRTLMQNTADEIGSVSYPGGVNEFYGHGRINAHLAGLAAGVDSNDRIATATYVDLNSITHARLGTTTDVDMYRINVSAGQRIGIDVDHFAGDTTDTYMRLFNSAGEPMLSSDDVSGPTPEPSTLEAYLEHTFLTGGNYYIGLSAFGNGSYNAINGSGKSNALARRLGNFQLHVNNISPPMLLVNNSSDTGDGMYFNGVTLREAIAFANLNSDSVVQFDTAGLFAVPQTIHLSGGQGQLTISQNMTVDGSNLVTVNAGGSSRVFLVNDGDNGQIKNVQITGLTISGGTGEGAGIFNRENLTITRSTISGNTGTNGGGIYAFLGQLTIVDSALVENTATRGGGLFVKNVGGLGNTIIRNSTISGNTASSGGGIENDFDIFSAESFPLSIENSTITNNQSAFGAGVRIEAAQGFGLTAETIVSNSIIAGNIGSDVQVNGPSNFSSLGFNLVGTGNAIGDFNVAGDITGVNPQLGPLQNNGGPTRTHALLPGSPAINRGNSVLALPPEFDQRGTGFPRIRGGVIDIGAVEAHPPVVDVIGNLTQPFTRQRNYDLRANEVAFYQFTLTGLVQAAGNQFLVIDTQSTLDTEIGLYDASGNRIANNDDYAGSLLSHLGFGDTADSQGDLTNGTYYLAIAVFNTEFGNSDFNVTNFSDQSGNVQVSIQSGTTAVSPVVGSFVNHAGYTGGGPSIDTGKVLAKESGTPTLLNFNNLINSSHGINGLVFDVQNLPATVTAANFEFLMSPTGAFNEEFDPITGWAVAPNPSSVTVTPGSPDRIAIAWPNLAIANRWLRVTILASASTGLAQNEVYYIGHLLGETTGASGSVFTVAFADIAPIRGAVGNTVNASSIHDIDKNGTVSFADISAMRSSVGSQLTIITIPAADGGSAGGSAPMFGGIDDGGSNRSDAREVSNRSHVATPAVNPDGNQSSVSPTVVPNSQLESNSLSAEERLLFGSQSEKNQRMAAVKDKYLLFGQGEPNSVSWKKTNTRSESESLALVFEPAGLNLQNTELEVLDAFFAKY